jgi:hypothetical protein
MEVNLTSVLFLDLPSSLFTHGSQFFFGFSVQIPTYRWTKSVSDALLQSRPMNYHLESDNKSNSDLKRIDI